MGGKDQVGRKGLGWEEVSGWEGKIRLEGKDKDGREGES